MLRHLRNARRVVWAGRCLARHNALFPLALLPLPARTVRILAWLGNKSAKGRPGERLAAALLELGPAFVKLGQSLAVRDDLIGVDVARDLAQLHDRMAPVAGTVARAVVEAELGVPIETVFARFPDEAAAAASVAQVHRALTTEGEDVAVKVLRPGVERRIERDLDLLLWLAEVAERVRPELRRYRPVDTVRTLLAITRREMDLRLEAAAAAELAETCADEDGFRVPRVDWKRTTRRVVTFEWIDGIAADDRAGLIAAGHDPDAILASSARVFFNQVFRDGFFHGDMHPGNMVVDAHSTIVALDFGIMGRIDLPTRRFLAATLLGFLNRDYARVAEEFIAAGFVPADQDREAFQQAVRAVGEPIVGRPLAEISMGRVLGQLLTIAEQFSMSQRPDLIVLQKTMVVAEGVGRRINPNVNIWLLAQPLVVDWIASHLGPQAELRRLSSEALRTARRLPELVRALEDRLRDPPATSAESPRYLLWIVFAAGLALGLALR